MVHMWTTCFLVDKRSSENKRDASGSSQCTFCVLGGNPNAEKSAEGTTVSGFKYERLNAKEWNVNVCWGMVICYWLSLPSQYLTPKPSKRHKKGI